MQQSKYLMMLNELHTMPERKIAEQLKGLETSLYAFDVNYREFRSFILSVTTDPKYAEVYYSRNRDQLERVMIEMLRLLHNFEAAVMSLVDHTRRLTRKLNVGEKTFPDYQERLNQEFVIDPLVQFVQQLRELCLHVRLPDIAIALTISPSSTESVQTVCLSKTDLMQYKKWDALPKSYLATLTEQIDILAITTAYYEKVAKFYAWFKTREYEIYAAEFQRIQDKEREFIIWRIGTEIDAHFAGAGGMNKEDIFRGALGSHDFTVIKQASADSFERAEQVIKLLEKHLPLSEELKKKIITLFVGANKAE